MLRSEDWSPDVEGAVLRVRQGAAAFARPARARASIEIPIGPSGESVFVTLAKSGWEVSGLMRADDVSLRPSRALVFGGFLIPLAIANLGWDQARPGELLVTATPSRGIKPASPVLREAHACADVTADASGGFDALAAVPSATSQRLGVLKARPGIPLSVTPAAPPVAWLDPPNGDAQVQVLDSRGAFVRIVWAHFEEIVFGWVPVADVRMRGAQASGAYGVIGGMGGAGGDGGPAPGSTRYRCERDVSLVVDVQGEATRVGRVLAGTTLEARDRVGAFVRVVAPAAGPVEAVDGVSFEVPEVELAGCRAER